MVLNQIIYEENTKKETTTRIHYKTNVATYPPPPGEEGNELGDRCVRCKTGGEPAMRKKKCGDFMRTAIDDFAIKKNSF